MTQREVSTLIKSMIQSLGNESSYNQGKINDYCVLIDAVTCNHSLKSPPHTKLTTELRAHATCMSGYIGDFKQELWDIVTHYDYPSV